MKKKILGLLLIVGIFSSSLTAFANTDSEYPAANFQPSVIFTDDSAKSTASSSVFDPDYPAANFQPKILYIDASATTSNIASRGKQSTFDPKYPAANFEPKVIYP